MGSYLRLLYCDPKTISNGSSEDFDRVEDNYISWIIAAFLFFSAAVYVKGFEADTSVVSTIFLIIVLLMLIIINFEYLIDRCNLLEEGQEIRNRLDYLFGIICIVIIVISIFALDSVRQQRLFSGFLELC